MNTETQKYLETVALDQRQTQGSIRDEEDLQSFREYKDIENNRDKRKTTSRHKEEASLEL